MALTPLKPKLKQEPVFQRHLTVRQGRDLAEHEIRPKQIGQSSKTSVTKLPKVALATLTAVSGRSATQIGDNPTVRKSPRVFVNTSIPFSVAPQPVPDTLEVAHAKQTFMKTFQKIHDAVIAADTEHLNYTVLDDDLTNNLDDGATGSHAVEGRTSFVNRGPTPFSHDVVIDEDGEPRLNLFPDPTFEPDHRKHQLQKLPKVALATLTAVSGRSATQIGDNPTVRKSPRVFVNTSIPFSVAPQPVPDTLEVAHAKQTFMKTFQKIHDAVIAADTEHLNYTVLDDDLTNNLDDGATGSHAVEGRTSFVNRGPTPFSHDVVIDEDGEPRLNLFPDPTFEPEYFLPSVHVDPVLLSQFKPSLPPNPFIQQIRPFTEPGQAGTCYEIILLEPEDAIFQFPRASQVIPVGTPALPSLGSRKPVPHFKAPQLSFLTLLQSGGPTGR
ncbi:uncharacterized protein [Palaemon carinicauda]|uniref:uncharacterized protein n=1 Tax=Palaemon carinicauda TaxID=392227 RepID=UPI0035B692D7